MAESSEIAIWASNISKTFKLPHEKQNSIKGLFISMFRGNRIFEKQHVLKDVSFEIKKGEFFGIVGRNGSGKSTLLKLMAGIYTPDSGHMQINGKLTPFIELGVGFNPELTGRENVFLNGALLGFSRKEMLAMYDQIVEFAELEKFMDQKLKNYSSGMQVRLAFSIAIKARNDILIFDEVLAVGDEAFQRKCLDIFESYKADGQTVVLVTHDMESVRRFCHRALVLDKGKILQIGEPHQVAATYSKLNMEEIEREMQNQDKNSGTNDLGMKISYEAKSGKPTASFKCGETMRMKLDYDNRPDFTFLAINIFKRSGEHLTGFRIPAEHGVAEAEVVANFSKGKYYTLIQAISAKETAVGSAVMGPDFIITTDKAPDLPAWSGLVPVDFKIVKS